MDAVAGAPAGSHDRPRSDAFWSPPERELLAALGTDERGLASASAEERRERFGPNALRPRERATDLELLLAQFGNPIVLLLLAAAALSFALRQHIDSAIVFAIVLASGLLGFFQERNAAHAVEKLLATVEVRASVVRDGTARELPVTAIVPGDIVLLGGGDLVPGDCRLLESKDLFVDEAAVTGETYPAEKAPAALPPDTTLVKRSNALWLGTHVVSGTGRAVVVRTGVRTELGRISERLRSRPPETEFERGVSRFGHLLLELTLLFVLAIFALNVYFARPVLESLLFAVALAVGLTPQLLPAIISVNLAHGATRMAERRVIVKRLSSIENFGSMSVLCTDKTGTITESVVSLASARDAEGRESDRVVALARVTSVLHTGFANPIDDALRMLAADEEGAWRKLDEVPYDFSRKRMSVLAEKGGERLLVVKGQLRRLLDACTRAETAAGPVAIDTVRDRVVRDHDALAGDGFRVLGVAARRMDGRDAITREDERDLDFVGMLVFAAPTKPGIAETVGRLRARGIVLKIVTGDARAVTAHVARELGIAADRVATGAELDRTSDAALPMLATRVDLFAELEPHHKERLVLALRKAGQVVGFLGDGINDAPALHSADVGISVQGAVDVAKEAADIVLLDNDLRVLLAGVEEGRATFANTLKYVFMATSANFGNMFSMAGVSLLLPFLPLLPKQVLLTNLLTDLPEMTIATDRVDPELVARPRRWDLGFIRRFMLVFGLVSSIFDYATFAALLVVLRAGEREFRTGWFVESVVSASLVVLVIRTRRAFVRSRPGKWLVLATAFVVLATAALPFTPVAAVFGFVPLPPSFLAMLAAIVVAYMATAEVAKRLFYRSVR